MSKKNLTDAQIIADFWAAPGEALFNQAVLAKVTHYSPQWFERQRWLGSGIPFIKIGKRVLYRKRDVCQWLNQHPAIQSTSQYGKQV